MNLIKSISIYAFFSFLEKGVAFFLLPVFTFYLTPQDYGVLATYQVILDIMTPLILLGTHAAINVEYVKNEFNDFSSYFSSGVLNNFIVFIFLLLLIFIFADFLSDLLEIPVFWIKLSPFIAFLRTFSMVTLHLFQIKKKAFVYGVSSLLNLVLNVGISILLIVVLLKNYEGRLIAILLATLIVDLLFLFYLTKKNYLTKKIRLFFMKDISWLGLSLLPNGLGYVIINSSDRFFINHYSGLNELGVYQVGYTIGSLILVLGLVFSKAWVPFFYELLKENTMESKRKIVQTSYLYLAGMALAVVVLSFIFAPILFMYFIEVSFSTGQKYVIWIALSYFFFSIYQIFGHILFFFKQKKVFFILGFFNIIFNLILNFLFVSSFGAIGAAYATCISFAVLAAVVVYLASKFYPLNWNNPFI